MVSSGWDDEDNPTFEKNTSDRYIIMQFIELYDDTKWEELSEKEKEFWVRQGYKKNNWKGKEIYEGDIVKYYKKIYKVVFHYGCFCLESKYGYEPLIDIRGEIEIIGNRFENPELLEVKDE